jgi:hypothetical protein
LTELIVALPRRREGLSVLGALNHPVRHQRRCLERVNLQILETDLLEIQKILQDLGTPGSTDPMR